MSPKTARNALVALLMLLGTGAMGGWLQTFYMLYAIPIIITALLPQVRTMYKK